MNADVFCLQETKMTKGQAEIDLAGYEEYWNSAVKKGYSGTAVFTRIRPLNVSYGLGMAEHDQEGRVITVEFDRHYLVNVYTPNAQRALARLDYRMRWEDDFRAYLLSLNRHKPVIVCGDMNVAHEEIDIKNPKSNRRNAGFTDEERAKMTALLQAGFIDTFRRLNPDKAEAYTWWSYMNNARERNVGWRIDYFVISERLAGSFNDAMIYADIYGSDHCPVGLEVDLR
jgi:exodeoxyribonuclease-3